jgi:hypothetical protein
LSGFTAHRGTVHDSRREIISSENANRPLLNAGGDDGDLAINRPSVHEYAMLEEINFVRREAQAEANLAYEDWRSRPCRETYAVYLAAQDRADAAHDELADYAQRVAA